MSCACAENWQTQALPSPGRSLSPSSTRARKSATPSRRISSPRASLSWKLKPSAPSCQSMRCSSERIAHERHPRRSAAELQRATPGGWPSSLRRVASVEADCFLLRDHRVLRTSSVLKKLCHGSHRPWGRPGEGSGISFHNKSVLKRITHARSLVLCGVGIANTGSRYVSGGVGELRPGKLPHLLELRYRAISDAALELGRVAKIRGALVRF